MRRGRVRLIDVLAIVGLVILLAGCAVRGPLGGVLRYDPPAWLPIGPAEPQLATPPGAPPAPPVAVPGAPAEGNVTK